MGSSCECVVTVSIMDNPSSSQAWVTFTDTDTHTPLIQYSNNNKAQHGASTSKTTSVSSSPIFSSPSFSPTFNSSSSPTFSSSSLSSNDSTMERRMSEFGSCLDVTQLENSFQDKYLALQWIQHEEDQGWSRQVLGQE